LSYGNEMPILTIQIRRWSMGGAARRK